MRQSTFRELVILSACQGKETDKMHTQILENLLKDDGYSYKACLNAHNDKEVFSFLVLLDDYSDLDQMLSIAKTFNQESILYSGKDRYTERIYTNDNKREDIGKLSHVDSVKDMDAYTILEGSFYAYL